MYYVSLWEEINETEIQINLDTHTKRSKKLINEIKNYRKKGSQKLCLVVSLGKEVSCCVDQQYLWPTFN